MIDTPTHANISDFKQRYQGVLGWLNPDKPTEKRAVYVASVGPSKVVFRDSSGNDFYANVDAGVQFEFIPTQKAWYNTDRNVFLVQRVPARQWKRGICEDNTQINEVFKGTLFHGPLELSWREAIFKIMTDTIDYEKATAKYLKGDRDSVALSKHFAMSGNSLYFYNIEVGKLDKTRITLSLPMVQQELSDLIRRNSLPFAMEVK